MSAYVCDHCHITAIAAFATVHHHAWKRDTLSPGDTRTDLEVLGQKLLDENHKSVNARYRENDSSKFAPCWHAQHKRFTPIEIIKAIHCYRYQSCEHEGWKGSEVEQLTAALLDYAVHSLPGYSDAAWGVDCGHAQTKAE